MVALSAIGADDHRSLKESSITRCLCTRFTSETGPLNSTAQTSFWQETPTGIPRERPSPTQRSCCRKDEACLIVRKWAMRNTGVNSKNPKRQSQTARTRTHAQVSGRLATRMFPIDALSFWNDEANPSARQSQDCRCNRTNQTFTCRMREMVETGCVRIDCFC